MRHPPRALIKIKLPFVATKENLQNYRKLNTRTKNMSSTILPTNLQKGTDTGAHNTTNIYSARAMEPREQGGRTACSQITCSVEKKRAGREEMIMKLLR